MEYEQIKKIIESCHLNFLIGSGASMPFLGTLKNIETLLTKLSEKEDSNKKDVIDASIKKHYFDVAIKGNTEILDGNSDKLNNTKKAYSGFISSIDTILNKRKTNLVSKQANLFTTNMDLFLEYILEDQKLAFNDGFSGRINPIFGTENFHNSIRKTSTHYEYQSEVPLFNIFKMHGSVNWKVKDDKISFDYGLNILNEINSIEYREEDFFDIMYNEDGSKEWKTYSIDELYKKETIKKEVHSKFIDSYNKLLMVNPTKLKFETTTLDVTFYELLRMYSDHLERENSVLFVIGFSFADEHIREITKRVASANPTLLLIIFAHSLQSKNDIEKEIPRTNNVKIIYDPKDDIKYSLEEIDKRYFSRLAKELSTGKQKEDSNKKEKTKKEENAKD